ncbi:MAG: hypothetical protein BJ554DRAFT_8109, partial [Olpidium bornovanus]
APPVSTVEGPPLAQPVPIPLPIPLPINEPVPELGFAEEPAQRHSSKEDGTYAGGLPSSPAADDAATAPAQFQGDPATALYRFEWSTEGDLPLEVGETVYVTNWDCGEGWAEATNERGLSGLFPATYLYYGCLTSSLPRHRHLSRGMGLGAVTVIALIYSLDGNPRPPTPRRVDVVAAAVVVVDVWVSGLVGEIDAGLELVDEIRTVSRSFAPHAARRFPRPYLTVPVRETAKVESSRCCGRKGVRVRVVMRRRTGVCSSRHPPGAYQVLVEPQSFDGIVAAEYALALCDLKNLAGGVDGGERALLAYVLQEFLRRRLVASRE